jgi:hypothetical protein
VRNALTAQPGLGEADDELEVFARTRHGDIVLHHATARPLCVTERLGTSPPIGEVQTAPVKPEPATGLGRSVDRRLELSGT